ncbi:MAG: hydrogenase iron-sulfur subunit [Caldisericia bacterium]|nr:hydrogenase iron-sulfur subunit [Caldisericia bacterium]MDD5688949.1 hydrogenase iron-sulfur subunit [Caldisericia bacterium]
MDVDKNNEFTPQIIIFCCENSAYRAADMAGTLRLPYPEGIRIISFPCAGRIEEIHILYALERGADGVIVLGCLKDSCKFIDGDVRAKKKVAYIKKILSEIGVEEDRVAFFNISPNMGAKFVELIAEMNKKVKELGPLFKIDKDNV